MSQQFVRAVCYGQHGNPSTVLNVQRMAISRPLQSAEDWVKLRVLAAPINPSDLNQIQGTYPILPRVFPACAGNEMVARVVEAGKHSAVKTGSLCIARSSLLGTWRTQLWCRDKDVRVISRHCRLYIHSLGITCS